MAEIRSINELEEEAAVLVARLSPKKEGATLITLSGELGSGKTTFTKALAKVLGVEENVTSPTFVLEKIYALPESSAFARLVHIDAYRLDSFAELLVLGFPELMKNPKNLVVMEWPERIANALPPTTTAIRIDAKEDGTRIISYG